MTGKEYLEMQTPWGHQVPARDESREKTAKPKTTVRVDPLSSINYVIQLENTHTVEVLHESETRKEERRHDNRQEEEDSREEEEGRCLQEWFKSESRSS